MAITLTIAQLVAALRLTDTTEELAEATRLHALASEITTTTAPGAPDVVQNECVVRLAAFLYDMPTAAPGDSYANAWRSSGAGRLALPYQIHRAGLTGEEAAAAAQNAVGNISNAVTDVQFAGDTLTVTYRDGQSETFTIATGGGGVDQDARDLAAAAQQAAESAATAAGNAQQEASNAHTAADNALAATVTNADAINALPPPGTAPATWAEVGNDQAIPSDKLPFSVEAWAQGTGDIPYSAFDSVVESWAIKDSTPPLEIIPDGRLPVARLLPAVTGTDDGKIAKVVGGAWAVGNDNTGGAKPGFSGGLANLTGLASAAGFVNITSGLVAGEVFNRGTFTVETAALRDKLVIPTTGAYTLMAAVKGEMSGASSSTNRCWWHIRLMREREGVAVQVGPEGTLGYGRNQFGTVSRIATSATSSVVELEQGDKVYIEGSYTAQNAANLFDMNEAYIGVVGT